jgi:hypothetical protein
VGERLKPAVLKFARQYSHLIQINNLAAHGTTSKWSVLGGLGERFVQPSGYFFFLSESTPKHSDNAANQDLEVLEV